MTLELSSFTNPMEKVKFLKQEKISTKTANRTTALPISLAFFPETSVFLLPGSGIGRKIWIRVRNEHPG
jgi:hypothetical protein